MKLDVSITPSSISMLHTMTASASGGEGSLYGDDLAFEVSAVPSSTMRIRLFYNASVTPDFEVDWGNGEVHTFDDVYSTSYGYLEFRNNSAIDANTVVRVKSPNKRCDRFQPLHSDFVTACKQLGDIGYISLASMFYNCRNMITFEAGICDTSSVTNMSSMFYRCYDITTIDSSGMNTSSVVNMSSVFRDCRSLTSLDISGFDTSSVTDMSNMFYSVESLTSLDVSGFVTSSVTNMSSMFRSCTGLTTLDISGFDTSSVTSMFGMFNTCSGLTTLDVSSLNTSSVTSMSFMFYDCRFITGTLDLTTFDTSSVTSMQSMFHKLAGDNSTSLTLNVTGWNTSSVTTMENMFFSFGGISILGLGGWDTSSLTNVYQMFYDTDRLTSIIDIDTWDITNVTSEYNFAFRTTGINTAKYDQILVAWEADVSAVVGYSNGGAWRFYNPNSPIRYTTGSAAETARTNLINNHGWTITDEGGT